MSGLRRRWTATILQGRESGNPDGDAYQAFTPGGNQGKLLKKMD